MPTTVDTAWFHWQWYDGVFLLIALVLLITLIPAIMIYFFDWLDERNMKRWYVEDNAKRTYLDR